MAKNTALRSSPSRFDLWTKYITLTLTFKNDFPAIRVP